MALAAACKFNSRFLYTSHYVFCATTPENYLNEHDSSLNRLDFSCGDFDPDGISTMRSSFWDLINVLSYELESLHIVWHFHSLLIVWHNLCIYLFDIKYACCHTFDINENNKLLIPILCLYYNLMVQILLPNLNNFSLLTQFLIVNILYQVSHCSGSSLVFI